jgi:tetratricopeptide (TPR) repeat protein
MRYRIAFIQNDSASMDRLARDTPADDTFWLRLQMQLAFLRGDVKKLRSLSDTAVKQQGVNRKENAAHELAWRAAVESFLGEFPLARKLCRQAEEVGNESALGIWGCASALGAAGDLAQAEALTAKLDRLVPEDTFQQQVLLPMARSIIENKRGNSLKAVDILAPVTQYPNGAVSYHRGQACLGARQYAKAATEFEKVIDHRGWPEWELFAPLSQLGLAQTYALQGDKDESRKAYDAFFTIWKDADPDIPILKQAKVEYAKLLQAPEVKSPELSAGSMR